MMPFLLPEVGVKQALTVTAVSFWLVEVEPGFFYNYALYYNRRFDYVIGC